MSTKPETNRQKVNRFLRTLRRIPDEVVLSVATREMDMGSYQSCLCGSAVREYLVAFNDEQDFYHASSIGPNYELTSEHSARLFGGTWQEWHAVFAGVDPASAESDGVSFELPNIEEAFTLRVMEATQ